MADQHIRRSGSDYAQALLSLLPYGQAWPRAVGSNLVETCEGLSDYWGTVDGRAADLLEQESDPRKTIELLTDWERNWGLPDPCFAETISLADRQRMLVFKMTLLGGQSRDFFITDVALHMLGYVITISEYAPFMAGISRAGDTRRMPIDVNNPLAGDFRWYIGGPQMRYVWTVHIMLSRLTWFRAAAGEAGVDPHLRIGIASDLQCLIDRWKPAHTVVLYDYSGEGWDDPMAGTP
jgi:uncharacterized protein YmfQ (DUF2313 family)